jgi:hypothetical protein
MDENGQWICQMLVGYQRPQDASTITFRQLAKKLKRTYKSVHRMLGPRGNPRAGNNLEIIKILHTNERVKLRVEAHKAAAQGKCLE